MSRISAREFNEWKILYQAEPWGEARGDIQAAMICMVIANLLQFGARRKRFSLEDFMVDWWEDIRRSKAQRVWESFKRATAHVAKKVKKKGKAA